MDTSECFIFGKICAYLAVFGYTGKYNPPLIAEMIICPLGHSALIFCFLGCKVFRSADNDMEFPVHSESATAQFSCSIYYIFFVLGA